MRLWLCRARTKKTKVNPEPLLAGVLEPVFAIRTEDDLGVGDTEGVRQMIDWCARHHLQIFQTLPINETIEDNSPYNALSSLAIEPSTIAVSPRHLPDLSPEDFQHWAWPQLLEELRRGPVNYPKAKPLKHALLQCAFDNFLRQHWLTNTDRAAHFRRFIQENAPWLSDYALFRALMEENGNTPDWERWRSQHRTLPDAQMWLLSLPENRREELARRQLFFSYVQWIAFGQWEALKSYAQERHVFLMGDVSFGVGRRSANVWANREIFDLDWSGGAPPEKTFKADPFTRSGARIGASRNIAGMSCAAAASTGGARASGSSGGTFIFTASIMSWVSSAFTLFRGPLSATPSFCR